MRRLTVLYDASCGLCVRCRWWLERQPQIVRLDFIPAGSPEALRRFPALNATVDELVAVSDEGGVYRGERAWILCLYALDRYREWALRLSQPALRPLARRAFETISKGRKDLSWLFGLDGDESPGCGRGGRCP